MSDEMLKPCPFCGSSAHITEEDGLFFAGCDECFCAVGEAYDGCAMPKHCFFEAEAAAKAWNTRAAASADPVADDLEDLVNRFSKALLAKLKLARANGRSGWERDDWQEHCQRGLMNHVLKGDPRDVAAYCAFAWHHGWPTSTAHPAPDAASELTSKVCPIDGATCRCDKCTDEGSANE